MWTSPVISPAVQAAVPTSPCLSVFPNDDTDASVIEHDKRERERRRNRWLAAGRTKETGGKCKTVWSALSASPESKLNNSQTTGASELLKMKSGQLQLPTEQKSTTPTRTAKPGKRSKPGVKPKTKRKSQSKSPKRRFPLKEQQWMRVPIRKESQTNRTPTKVKQAEPKLKITTHITSSTPQDRPSTATAKKSSQSDVFTRLARSRNQSPSHAIRLVYSKKSAPTVQQHQQQQ